MLAQKSPARVKTRRCIYSLICRSPALARFARESRKTRNSLRLSKKSYKSATIAVYWVGPALGAVLGTGLFKAAYKGESKKKSKRKTR